MQIIRDLIDTSLVTLLHLLSYLPLRLLYVISSLLTTILFSVFRYKRVLVTANLARAFPETNEQTIQSIAKQTYKHHLDLLAELIKTLRLNKQEFSNLVTITNPELIDIHLNNNEPVLLVTSHYGNWEWLQLACAVQFRRAPSVLYKRINHPRFDQLLVKLRTHFGSRLIATDNIVRELQKMRQTPAWFAMAADLAPRPEENRYWATFLGLETAFYSGIPRIAEITHATIIYGHMRRIRRGHYELTFEQLAGNSEALSENDIMERYINALESDIKQMPSDWIWFYKRWKHERPQSEQVGHPQHD